MEMTRIEPTRMGPLWMEMTRIEPTRMGPFRGNRLGQVAAADGRLKSAVRRCRRRRRRRILRRAAGPAGVFAAIFVDAVQCGPAGGVCMCGVWVWVWVWVWIREIERW
jgi:hypothetical protein